MVPSPFMCSSSSQMIWVASYTEWQGIGFLQRDTVALYRHKFQMPASSKNAWQVARCELSWRG